MAESLKLQATTNWVTLQQECRNVPCHSNIQQHSAAKLISKNSSFFTYDSWTLISI